VAEGAATLSVPAGTPGGEKMNSNPVEIFRSASGQDRDDIVHAMHSFAAVTVALASIAFGVEHELAPCILSALTDEVCGIALYATGSGEDAVTALVSHAGFRDLPPDDRENDTPRAHPLHDLLKTGAGDRLICFQNGERPAWLVAGAAALAVFHFAVSPQGSTCGYAVFALRQAKLSRPGSELLLLVSRQIGDRMAAKREGIEAHRAASAVAIDGPIRVLLIDDEPLLVTTVARALEQRGFMFQSAQSARHGLKLADGAVFDVILIDKVLPDMDGIELLAHMRRDEHLSTVPVIMLSGYADESARIGALRAGADDFVAKPFSVKELVARIEANVRMAQARRAAVWRESEVLRLRQSQQELRKLLDTVQNVRAEERRLLAREVHDQLGQLLTAAKIDIRLLEHHVARRQEVLSSEDILRELRSALSSIDLAIESVQNISILLRPPALENGGLIAALRWQAADFERRSKINCSVIHDAEGYSEPTKFVAGELFRICQEALTNVLRHAGASCVRISVAVRGCNLVVRVCDNGVGIDRGAAQRPSAIGIAGIRERAISIRATLQFRGRPGRGTVLAIRRRRALP
jgi:signal transduction histidine kinase